MGCPRPDTPGNLKSTRDQIGISRSGQCLLVERSCHDLPRNRQDGSGFALRDPKRPEGRRTKGG